MKIYISGEMTGKNNYNFKLFNDVATRLFVELESRYNDSIEIINPASISMQVGTNKTRAEYLREDIKQLVDCDIIIMLDGWENSKSAILERVIAEGLGLAIIEKNEVYPDMRFSRIQKIVFGDTK